MSKSILDYKCVKCGEIMRRMVLLALAIDAGAQTSNPCKCPEGGNHDFQEAEDDS